MTAPKKYQYRIQYVDNTYQMVDWTKAEYKLVGEAIIDSKPAVMLDEGIFRVSDVRAIVLIPELPEPEKTDETKNHLTEWGFVDTETAQWLRANGIDVSEVEQ